MSSCGNGHRLVALTLQCPSIRTGAAKAGVAARKHVEAHFSRAAFGESLHSALLELTAVTSRQR